LRKIKNSHEFHEFYRTLIRGTRGCFCMIHMDVIFYYHRLNSYSFNALAGAIDSDADLAETPIGLALTGEQLLKLTADALKRHDHAVVALSILTCQSGEMRHLIRQLRSNFGSRITIAAGGPHVNACADEALGTGADVVFRGEAEATFPETLKRIALGQEFQNVQSPKNPVDLDACFSFSPRRGMFGPIEITRGCAFACSYCQTSHIFGTRLRHRSIGNIISQAEALRSINRKVVRLLSPNAFSFGSPDGLQLNFAAMRELLAALRKVVTARGKIIFAHFPSEARPEHVTSDTLDLLKEFADNDEIVIGAQSGSQRMLDACHRSHTVEDVLAAVTLARKYGYKVIVDFIFGLPGESEADERETLAVIEKVVYLGARIHPHIFAPLPQTPFSREQPGSLSPVIVQALDGFKSRRSVYGNSKA
jgi:B12-binding domain/radical SAM domain protein